MHRNKRINGKFANIWYRLLSSSPFPLLLPLPRRCRLFNFHRIKSMASEHNDFRRTIITIQHSLHLIYIYIVQCAGAMYVLFFFRFLFVYVSFPTFLVRQTPVCHHTFVTTNLFLNVYLHLEQISMFTFAFVFVDPFSALLILLPRNVSFSFRNSFKSQGIFE